MVIIQLNSVVSIDKSLAIEGAARVKADPLKAEMNDETEIRISAITLVSFNTLKSILLFINQQSFEKSPSLKCLL